MSQSDGSLPGQDEPRGGVRDGEAFGSLSLAEASDYLAGWNGENDLSVGPHMLAWALECTLARVGLLESALTAAIEVADQARGEWDAAPQGMKAGKLLIALSGHAPGYRADIDAIHAIHRAAVADTTDLQASPGRDSK